MCSSARTIAGRQSSADLISLKVGICFHAVVDIFGPIRLAAQSRAKCILVLTDLFAKYAISLSCVVAEAKEVGTETVECGVLHFCDLKVLHTDQGKKFSLYLIEELCKLFKKDKTKRRSILLRNG